MRRTCRTAVVLFVALSLILVPLAGSVIADDEMEAPDRSAEGMIFDAVILRPVGLVATVLGSALWVVALPFSLLGGNTAEATEKLVKAPAAYTFQRPLGEF